jgi:hypothetical protein
MDTFVRSVRELRHHAESDTFMAKYGLKSPDYGGRRVVAAPPNDRLRALSSYQQQ